MCCSRLFGRGNNSSNDYLNIVSIKLLNDCKLRTGEPAICSLAAGLSVCLSVSMYVCVCVSMYVGKGVCMCMSAGIAGVAIFNEED